MTTNNKPLWRVLNEQAKSILEGDKVTAADIENGIDKKGTFPLCEYAALAVNNLSYLAEALEKCIKFSSKDPQLIRDIAREALNRIS